jgi:hypothetical protein
MQRTIFNLIIRSFQLGSRKRRLEEQNYAADDDDAVGDSYKEYFGLQRKG